MGEGIGKQNSLHRPKPIDHLIEKQPFDLCVLWLTVLCLLECVEHAAAVGMGMWAFSKGGLMPICTRPRVK